MDEKEKDDKVDLTPVEETPEPPPSSILDERTARFLVNEITHICTIAQESFELTETSNINRSPNFYIDEMMRSFKEYGLIID